MRRMGNRWLILIVPVFAFVMIVPVVQFVPGSMKVIAAVQESDSAFDISLSHVALSVPDIEASVAWYQDMFGFEVVGRGSDPTVPANIVQLVRGDIRIELFYINDAASLPAGRHDPTEDLRTHGLKHFAFQVEDIRAVLADLQARGVEVTKELTESERSLFVFISDNSGNSLELIQPKQ